MCPYFMESIDGSQQDSSNSIVNSWELQQSCAKPPGGALGQFSYGGVQLRGSNPYPILGKAGLRKYTLF